MEVGGNGVLIMTGGSIDTTGGLWYGVYAQSGSEVTLDGTTINATLSCVSGNGLEKGAVVELNDVDFTSEMVAAVFFPSTQSLTVTGGSFTGATGFDIRAGTVKITGAEITIDLTNPDWTGTSGPSSFGMGVAVFDHASYSGDIDVTVSGCTINNAVYDYYVGGLNLAAGNAAMDADTAGVGSAGFDASKVADEHKFEDTIEMRIPGFAFKSAAGQVGYQFAAVDATDSSFTVPAGWVVSGIASFDKDSSASSAKVLLFAGNGGLTFSKGSVEISGIMTAAEVAAEISSATGEVVLKNLTITDGTLSISGDVAVEGNVIVSENATIAIGTNSSLDVAENAVLSVSGKVTTNQNDNTSILNNEGTVAITNTKAEIPDTIGGSGNVDSSAVASEGTLSGSYDTTTTFTQNQVITVTSDTILVEGTQFVFEGKLIIPEGVTLTIEAGAQLVVNSSTGIIENNGIIVIESDAAMTATGKYIEAVGGFAALGTSKIINNGTIELAYYADVDGTAATNGQFTIASTATVENNGTINVGEESILKVSGTLNNAADATINMNGHFEGTIKTAGTVNINGTTPVSSTGAYITFTDAGATVQIDSLTGTIRIDDSGISNKNITVVTSGSEAGNDTRLVNYVRISSGAIDTADANMIVSGITVTSEITSKVDENNSKVTYYYNNVVLSGSVSADYVEAPATTTPATAGIRTDGPRAVVSGELILDANVTFEVKNKLTVSGTINVDEDATFTGTAKPTLEVTTGTVAIEANAIGTTTMDIVASYYKVAKTTTTPEMHYYTTLANALASGATPITVYGPLTIDEALTVNDGITVNAQGTVDIEEEGSLTVNDGGRFNASTNTVTVDGSLYAAVEKTGLRGTSNIKSDVVSRGEADVLYTNLYSALNAAESGDTVTLSQSKTTDRDITVKEGVVLKTGANTLTLGNDTVATVNGTIYTNGGALAVETTLSGSEKAGSVTLNGLIQSDMPMEYGGAYPAGAYYSITTTGKVLYYIAPVEDAAAIISTVDQSTITINGDLTIGDVSFAGTADEGAVIIIKDEVTAGTVTLDLAELQIVGKFAGTVTDGTGTVAINVSGSETAAISSEMVDDAKAFVVSGTFGNTVMEDTKYAFTVTGTVDVDEATIPGVTVEGTMDVVGNSSVTGALVIKGTVNVDAGVTLTANTANSITTIAGALNALVDDDGTKATVTLGEVYVGLEVVDEKIVTATAGEITGTVTYTTLYVSADSTVPAAMTDKKAFTGFYVEDALWLTAYGTTAVVTNAPVENADFKGWDNPKTETKEYYDGSDITISAQERLDAVINYNVYTVYIYVDNGIGTVAIDGSIATQGTNYYVVKGLTAGQHTVSYTLKNNFEGTPALSSENVTVSGLVFTLAGDFEDANGNTIVYVLNLSGTTPADTTVVIDGGSGDDGMSLTDILLIVLVVLILVMAIIVALRLMRS